MVDENRISGRVAKEVFDETIATGTDPKEIVKLRGLEQISDELAGKVTVAKVNIEDSPTTPSRYGVRGIPTMMLFRGGQMASMKVGAMPKQKILEWLSEAGAA